MKLSKWPPRRRRETLILATLETLPDRAGYPTQVAEQASLNVWQTWVDLDRMSQRGRGVHRIPGQTRYNTGL